VKELRTVRKWMKKAFYISLESCRKKLEGICKYFCINLKNLRLWTIVQWFVLVFLIYMFW